MEPLVILVIILFLIQLIMVGLFVWLLSDTRREGRLREERDDVRQTQLISVNQTLANQLPQIAGSLLRIETNIEKVVQRS